MAHPVTGGGNAASAPPGCPALTPPASASGSLASIVDAIAASEMTGRHLTASGVAPQTVLTSIATSPLLFAPGAAYSYSNSNYYVLGSIIEAASGSTYAPYLSQNVLQPAQLTDTTYLQPMSSASPYTGSWAAGDLWDA